MAAASFLSFLQPLHEQPNCARGDVRHPHSLVGDAQKEAEARVQAALAEAEAALSQAKQDAGEMLDDARVQAETLREAAWQEGFHNGRDAGRIAVEMDLQKQHDTRLSAWREEIEALTESICAARQEMWDAQESDMVAFVIEIARQVVKTEVTQNPQVVTEVLHNALRRVTDKDHVRIRVSLADAAEVRGMREDLLNLMDGVKNLEIVDDRRIGQGGCVVETNAGTIDAKIETQMDEVERVLNHAIDR